MKKCLALLLTVILAVQISACGQNAPTWQEQYDLGLKYLSEGNYEEAIIAFTAAIEIDPKQALTYAGRGDAYIGSGESEENLTAAQADYEQAIELDATSAEAYLGLTDVYIRRGEYERAMEVINKGLTQIENEQLLAKKKELENGTVNDSFGEARKMSTYDNSGHLLYYHNYTYKQEQKLASVTAYDSKGRQISYVSIDYNDDGHPLSGYLTNYNGTLTERTFEYDELGNQIREDCWPEDGTHWYYLHEYNETGKCIQSDWYYDDSSELHHSMRIYTYDDIGNQTSIIDYDDEGTMLSRQDFTYNSVGNCLSFTYSDSTGVSDRYLYHYDELGEYLGEDHYDGNGNLVSSTVNK